VDCTVFAPSEAHPGDSVVVQVLAHTPGEAPAAQAAAAAADAEARPGASLAIPDEVPRGSRLTFELIARGLAVHDPVQELTWLGRMAAVQFEVEVPRNAEPGRFAGKVLVAQDSVPIGQMCFALKVVAKSAPVRAEPTEAGSWSRYRKAFISYASRDRPEVLRRVQMLPLVGVECFQDLLHLDPGERWERALYRHIDDSDVMFLFWSSAARDSEWVTREWRYGLERKGEDFVRPVIIEGPPIVPPPPELEGLHFNDRVLYFLAAEELAPSPVAASSPKRAAWVTWALFEAAAQDDLRAAEQALSLGATPHVRGGDVPSPRCESVDQTGLTPLHVAAISNARRVASLLLARGADANAEAGKDSFMTLPPGGTPLHAAAMYGSAAVARLLLAGAGPLWRRAPRADVEARDDWGRTALHQAALRGGVAVGRLLLGSKAEIGARDGNGATPLHLAAGSANHEMARLLMAKGADLGARDGNGKTALRSAEEAGRESMVALLRERGATD